MGGRGSFCVWVQGLEHPLDGQVLPLPQQRRADRQFLTHLGARAALAPDRQHGRNFLLRIEYSADSLVCLHDLYPFLRRTQVLFDVTGMIVYQHPDLGPFRHG